MSMFSVCTKLIRLQRAVTLTHHIPTARLAAHRPSGRRCTTWAPPRNLQDLHFIINATASRAKGLIPHLCPQCHWGNRISFVALGCSHAARGEVRQSRTAVLLDAHPIRRRFLKRSGILTYFSYTFYVLRSLYNKFPGKSAGKQTEAEEKM